MGRNKALLPIGKKTCIEYVTDAVSKVAGSMVLIGESEGLEFLGIPMVPDLRPGMGPLGGLETGLTITTMGTNIVVACDMPCVTPDLLNHLLREAEGHDAVSYDAVIPTVAGRAHPLCAVYARACLPMIQRRLDNALLRVSDLAQELNCRRVSLDETVMFRPDLLLNVNTPGDVALAMEVLKRHGDAS
jgi:molybdopterin-guanine dinucleotide biosynthesis protein A